MARCARGSGAARCAPIVYRFATLFGMRDIRVSFAKIRRRLGFEPRLSVEAGIQEVRDALLAGVIKDPWEGRHRNAEFVVQ